MALPNGRTVVDIITDAYRELAAQRQSHFDSLADRYAHAFGVPGDVAYARTVELFADTHEHTFTRGFDDAFAYLDADDPRAGSFRIEQLWDIARGSTCPGTECPAVERARADGWV